MRTSICAQSAASVPPTPALIATTASRSSYGLESWASSVAWATSAPRVARSRSRSADIVGSSAIAASSARSFARAANESQRSSCVRTRPRRLRVFWACWRSFQRSGRADSTSSRSFSFRRAGRSKEHRHAVDALAQGGERGRVYGHASALVAGPLERGHDRLGHGCQLAGREAHEGHAGAVGVPRAARAVAVAVEGGAVGTLEAVVLADDPF